MKCEVRSAESARGTRAGTRRRRVPPIALVALVGLCGCVTSVPETSVRFVPKTHELILRSPKNVHFDSATVTQEGTNFTLTILNYSSTNDNQVITTVAAAQAQVAKNASDTITSLANLGAAVAAKAP